MGILESLQGGEQAEQLMQASKVPSPAEEAGYQMPDARQHPYRYIPPGFIIESSGRIACALPFFRAAEGRMYGLCNTGLKLYSQHSLSSWLSHQCSVPCYVQHVNDTCRPPTGHTALQV